MITLCTCPKRFLKSRALTSLLISQSFSKGAHKVCLALGDYNNIKAHCCIGGTSVRDDIDKLREGMHLVVGTPGRVLDMCSKRHLKIDDLITFVLDEADEMLSRGFKDQIYDIFKMLPPNVQVCLQSLDGSVTVFLASLNKWFQIMVTKNGIK